MRAGYPEPSINDCGAPWNDDDEGGCDCSQCQRERNKAARDERRIDDYEDQDRAERRKCFYSSPATVRTTTTLTFRVNSGNGQVFVVPWN